MAENTSYTAAAAYVKVEIGPADGNRVARIIRRGHPIPDGVDPKKLSELEALGLIEPVTAEPEPEPDADAKAKADADAKAAAAKTPAK
ncbi:MAG: hypothetical protein J7474_04710 [Arthrobacter sp.]|nr:hypothetical protein [Arthrobacter sp.]